MAEQTTSPAEEKAKGASPFVFAVSSLEGIQALRVRTQIRDTHLSKNETPDPFTQSTLQKLKDLESDLRGGVADLLENHPAYHWFSQVRGIGNENIAKILGPIDIRKARTISALWKFCGYHVREDGGAPKRVKGGGKLEYNSQLRTRCYRVAESLMRARGFYYDFYLDKKEEEEKKLKNRGVEIVPATKLPKKNGKHVETETMISEKHVHMRALRKMIKLFLSHLWIEWRKGEGLPVSNPYVQDVLNHTHIIEPWQVVEADKKKRTRSKKK